MKNTIKLTAGKWYKINDRGETHTAQYIGRASNSTCIVCEKGCKAHTFNVFYSNVGYESWGYGNDHLPQIIEELEAGDEVIVDE
jgi:hypothetical protein